MHLSGFAHSGKKIIALLRHSSNGLAHSRTHLGAHLSRVQPFKVRSTASGGAEERRRYGFLAGDGASRPMAWGFVLRTASDRPLPLDSVRLSAAQTVRVRLKCLLKCNAPRIRHLGDLPRS